MDYNEIYSPVVRHSSIRVLLSMVVQYGMILEQLDVKQPFVHGNLEEEIYMCQLEGYENKGSENMVYLLKKSLYGLKQSPRQWYLRFDEFMASNGYLRSLYDSCVYQKWLANGVGIFLLLYVDDMLIASVDHLEMTDQRKN